MKIDLRAIAKEAKRGLLEETTFSYSSNQVVLVCAETDQRPIVLGLIASGRMKPDHGEVLIDDASNNRLLRRKIALVDAPEISEPEPNVLTRAVVQEQLMFAGHRANPASAMEWLRLHEMSQWARVPIANMRPSARIRMLLLLAAERPKVNGIVLVSPERHGGDPDSWWHSVTELAERGYAMLVITGVAAAKLLSNKTTPLYLENLEPTELPS